MAELERIAYDNALRALDRQERLLEELRARTGVLIAASSLAATLLGGRSVENIASSPLLALALVAFVVSLGASLRALRPSDDLVFALRPDVIYHRLFAFRHDVAQIHVHLANELQRYWDANERHVDTIRRALQIATWSLAVEVLALMSCSAIRSHDRDRRRATAASVAAHPGHRPSGDT
ncbi:hypothetical protein DSM104299_04273 [Baekduia alba]|uniref:hypothetical protein n=1 Tax=Baekduia alba TaxID=2997333 RepID=UPI00234254EA|nr:hypothetical protein [Baekduia alba]WCB95524.1 hypothetical protein DSM104299_04273 [Baekduia alba]